MSVNAKYIVQALIGMVTGTPTIVGMASRLVEKKKKKNRATPNRFLATNFALK